MKKNFLSVLVLSAASLVILGACGNTSSVTPSENPSTSNTSTTTTSSLPPSSIIPSTFENTVEEVKGFIERGLETSVNSVAYTYEYVSSGRTNRTNQTFNFYENAMLFTTKALNPYESTPENEVYRENNSEYRTIKDGRYYTVFENLNDLIVNPQLNGFKIVADDENNISALNIKQSEVTAALTYAKTSNNDAFGLGTNISDTFLYPLNTEDVEFDIVSASNTSGGFTSTVAYAIEGEYNPFSGAQYYDTYSVAYTFDGKFDLVNVEFDRKQYNKDGYDFDTHEITGEPVYPYNYTYEVKHGEIVAEATPKYNISDISCTDFEVKVYKDEACTQEISPLELKTDTDYYVEYITNPVDAYDVIVVSGGNSSFGLGKHVTDISYDKNQTLNIKFMSATGVEKQYEFKFEAPKLESLYIDEEYIETEISVGDKIYLPHVESNPSGADGSCEFVVTEGEDIISIVDEGHDTWTLAGLKAGTAKYKAVSKVDPTISSNEITITVKEALSTDVVIAAITSDTWYGSYYGNSVSLKMNADGTAFADFGKEMLWGLEGRYESEKSTTLSFNWEYNGKFTVSNVVWSLSDEDLSNFVGYTFEGVSINGDASELSLNLKQADGYAMSFAFRPPVGFEKASEVLTTKPWSCYSMDLSIEIYVEFASNNTGVIGIIGWNENYDPILDASVTFTWAIEGENLKITSFASETLKWQVYEWDESTSSDVLVEKTITLAACDVELDVIKGEDFSITLDGFELLFMEYWTYLSE